MYRDKTRLVYDYLQIFDLTNMQTAWQTYLNDMIRDRLVNQGDFDEDITEILKADFRKLCDIYLKFCRINYPTDQIRASWEGRLKGVFDYEACQPLIARFFMQHKDIVDISTCYYCDMAYINCFGAGIYDEKTAIEYLNTASGRDIKKHLGYSDRIITSILSNRATAQFADATDFNNRRILYKISLDSVLKRAKTKKAEKNHFDLDHVLVKDDCPIVALSLFNFVPSCQVCNQKLKRKQVLGGKNIDAMCRYSPTCDDYSFEEDVEIVVEPMIQSTSYVTNQDRYRIRFDCTKNKDYEKEVDLFHLDDRYNYHKVEALRLMDLKQGFPDERIEQIAEIIYGNRDVVTVKKTHDDIFQNEFNHDYHRVFGKLYSDILK